MSVKIFLNTIRSIDMMIDCKLEQIEELRSLLTGGALRYDKENVQTSLSNDLLPDTIANIIDLEQKINEDIDELIKRKEKARVLIEMLEDEGKKIVLYKRYFDNKTFEEISVECGYSWRHVHRLHGNALRELEKYKMS